MFENGIISYYGITEGEVLKTVNTVLSNVTTMVAKGGVNSQDTSYFDETKANSWQIQYGSEVSNENYLGLKIIDSNGNTAGYLVYYVVSAGYNSHGDWGGTAKVKVLDADYNTTWTWGDTHYFGTLSNVSHYNFYVDIYEGTDGNNYIAFIVETVTNAGRYNAPGIVVRADMSPIEQLGALDISSAGISPEFGYASEEEGYTGYDFDDTSDLITPDPAPRYGVSSPGFVHVYSTTPDGLALFGEALFPEPASATTTEDLLNELNKILFNGKMIDYVLDTHIIPFTPTIGEQERIKLGGKYISTGEDTYLYGYTVASDYEDIDCGTLSLPLKFKNFLDFNVQCKLFLPFVGFVSIPPEYWIGGTIGVKYRFNVIDGSFVCFVTGKAAKSNLDGSLVGQYSGSACIHIPITGASYASLVSGLVSTVGGVAAGAAAGGAIGALSAAAASGLSNIQNLTPDYQQSNGYTGSAAMLGHRTPFLLIEFPVPQFSEMFPDEIGLPLNVAKSLSSVSGFTIVDASRITVAGASAEELDEIKSLLEKGVIL